MLTTSIMFLHPRDLIEVYEQSCDNPEQHRFHIMGKDEINGMPVISDFHRYLKERGVKVQNLATVATILSGPDGVLMDNEHNQEFYAVCPSGDIADHHTQWSNEWRTKHGYSTMPSAEELG